MHPLTAADWITLGVDSPAAKYSPGNWRGDAGRGGALYRQTWNNGAWFSYTWLAAAHAPQAVLLLGPESSSAHVSVFLNGVLIDEVPTASDKVLSGIVPGVRNTVVVHASHSWQWARWQPATHVVRSFGLKIDRDSAPGLAPPPRPWCLLVGDSITEGIQARDGADHALSSYAAHLAAALDLLGYDAGISACGYSGWLRPGDSDGDVPPYCHVTASIAGAGGDYDAAASRWHRIDAEVSLLDADGRISAHGAPGTAPALILINYLTNDVLCQSNLSDLQASVTRALCSLRAAAPDALILILIPSGLHDATTYPDGDAYVAALRAAVQVYRATATQDVNVVLHDLGAARSPLLTRAPYATPGGVHPSAAGHALLGARLAALCATLLTRRQ